MKISEKLWECEYCGKQFTNRCSMGAHVLNCKNSPHYIQYKKPKVEYKDYEITCPICGNKFVINISIKAFENGSYRKCCSSKCSHILTAINTNKVSRNIKISNSLIVNNIHKETNLQEKINKYLENPKFCKNCGNIIPFKIKNRKYCCDKCTELGRSKNLSESCKIAFQKRKDKPFERKGFKSGWYKGIYCDSGWELAFVIYNLEHNKQICRCKKKLTYEFEGKTFNYYPDFEIDGIIYEIKGFENDKAKAKKEQHPEVKVLYKSDLKEIFKYATNKYGKDFYLLYEDKQIIINNDKPLYDITNNKACWFNKINENNKAYIQIFSKTPIEYNYYINNDWNIGRVSDYIKFRYNKIVFDRKLFATLNIENKIEFLDNLLLN